VALDQPLASDLADSTPREIMHALPVRPLTTAGSPSWTTDRWLVAFNSEQSHSRFPSEMLAAGSERRPAFPLLQHFRSLHPEPRNARNAGRARPLGSPLLGWL
jgi:hypothetical protein